MEPFLDIRKIATLHKRNRFKVMRGHRKPFTQLQIDAVRVLDATEGEPP